MHQKYGPWASPRTKDSSDAQIVTFEWFWRPTIDIWGVFAKAREGGIEPGPSHLPPTSRVPNHWATPALQPGLPGDFLCTPNNKPCATARGKFSSVVQK